MKRKQYVKIKKVNGSRYWYADKIGEIFKVSREYNSDYAVYNGSIDACLVAKEDAELIVTEKRPAKVGDKVLILDDFNEPRYMLHDEVPVIGGVDNHGVGVRKPGEFPIYLNNEQYEVIVNDEVKNEEADEMNKMLVDQAKTVFERKDDKYFGYKSRLGDIVIGGAYSYAFVVHYAKTNEDVVIIPGDVNTVTTPVCTTKEERLWKPEKTAQERRDEIVEQAKADIAKLAPNGVIKRPIGECDAEFIVNRNKRTVVVLIKGRYSGRVYVKGIAKAAPDDCFNEHIGKAIALHRALGIEVPDEYLNAPQPTEVRVGDVVGSFEFNEVADYYGKIVDVSEDKVFYKDGGFDYLPTVTEGIDEYGEESFLKIIDDSRTGVGE